MDSIGGEGQCEDVYDEDMSVMGDILRDPGRVLPSLCVDLTLGTLFDAESPVPTVLDLEELKDSRGEVDVILETLTGLFSDRSALSRCARAPGDDLSLFSSPRGECAGEGVREPLGDPFNSGTVKLLLSPRAEGGEDTTIKGSSDCSELLAQASNTDSIR